MASGEDGKRVGFSKGWILLFLLALFGLGGAVDRAIPILAIIFGFIASPFWYLIWLKNKRQIAAEKAQLEKKNPQDEEKTKRLEDRMANLEALICRLDSEINQQIERSLSRVHMTTAPDQVGVSHMPTAFMNVASVLESRYQVLKELGRGGMGIVFQAYDKQLKEQVAIKILSPMLSNDPDALERLKREVSAARRITHPGVIRIHDIAETGGLNYVSMEFFQGSSLKDYVRQQGALSPRTAFLIASQVCDALEAAHRHGVIHRDLKSQNVLINSHNQVKIIDFGLARTEYLEGMTATGLIMGSPEYMAPEQVAGKRVDERADIYSLGIILYELFTGRLPFIGDSAISVGFMQMKDNPPPPREVNPHVPPEVEAVILKALEKDPFHRYRDVAAFRADLERAVSTSVVAERQETISRTAEAQRVRE